MYEYYIKTIASIEFQWSQEYAWNTHYWVLSCCVAAIFFFFFFFVLEVTSPSFDWIIVVVSGVNHLRNLCHSFHWLKVQDEFYLWKMFSIQMEENVRKFTMNNTLTRIWTWMTMYMNLWILWTWNKTDNCSHVLTAHISLVSSVLVFILRTQTLSFTLSLQIYDQHLCVWNDDKIEEHWLISWRQQQFAVSGSRL